jgi:transposase InsO family protein
MEWAATQGIALSHIQPGKPQQNAYVERYNRTVRHEWLDQYIIESIEEAQEFATQWGITDPPIPRRKQVMIRSMEMKEIAWGNDEDGIFLGPEPTMQD